MAGERGEEIQNPKDQIVTLETYRKLVKSYLDLHLYSSALFWSDKVSSLSNHEPQDVYWLAQCMFHTKQYHRAAHILRSHGLDKAFMLCKCLTARCLFEAKELNEALAVLEDDSDETTNISHVTQQSIGDCVVEPLVGESPSQVLSSLLYIKGCIYEAMDNRGLATECYRQALQQDVHCYEAFDALIKHQMLSAQEEKELLESLPLNRQCPEPDKQMVRYLYESGLKKYHHQSEILPPPPIHRLSSNLELVVAQAERLYYNCDYQQCYNLTDEVLKQDPYHSSCLPIHIACLVEMKKSNKLFYLAHHLVDLYPNVAISWFAVGCYYYVIGKSDPARRYLSKSTTLDRLFGPAWLAYGHSFAGDNEHDQAMAAYFKASQLMKGCHLPLLYIGLECGLTNNARLAEKFFCQAKNIAPDDPFVIHEMGVIAFQNKDYMTAESHFMEALLRVRSVHQPVILEKWEPLLNNLGHTCRKLQKYEEALEFHQQALVLSPLNPSTYSAIGYVRALMGNAAEAVEAFHKALGLRRDDTFSTTLLCSVVEQLMDETPPFEGAPDKLPVLEFPSGANLSRTLEENNCAEVSQLLTSCRDDLSTNAEETNIEKSAMESSSGRLFVEVEMQDTSNLSLETWRDSSTE